MAERIERHEITLTSLEPFRIGAPQDVMEGVDNPIATIGGRAAVLGPTLKGALRANIEKHLIEQYPNDEDMKPCIPSSESTLSDEERKLISTRIFRAGGSCLFSRRNKSSSICPACYLLGAQGLVGFVRVPFLMTDVTPEELYSVRIDRAAGVVSERTNREYQILPQGTQFIGVLEILMQDFKGWEMGKHRQTIEGGTCQGDKWLKGKGWSADKIKTEFILDRLTSITLLGGFKSKGCGKVSIQIRAVAN